MEQIKKKDNFLNHKPKEISFWQKAMDYAVSKTAENIKTFTDGYPAPASVNLIYPKIANTEWTSSFWNGMLWQAYNSTGDKKFRSAAESTLTDYENRLEKRINTATHDLGFLYILSAKAEYLTTGNKKAREVAIKAADLLMERYGAKTGVLQAWGSADDVNNMGRIIIDCLMNTPLLFWASEATQKDLYANAAKSHVEKSKRFLIRDDDTTFHTYYFDVKTGDPLRGKTAQGYSDSSCWARGQAWGIYGFCLNYRYTGDFSLLEAAKRLANHFLNCLPEDNVCYWDLIFTSGNEERDSSAAAIGACGLMELASLLPVSDKDRCVYEAAALAVMESLAASYTTEGLKSNGILQHAVYSKPGNKGIDECNIWGDYFYMEALDRILYHHRLFW
ncbi:glycoside hydrolase family 88 protein [Treponema parvum]|uniref:glycoside hydrolase family 88 protein n=1 Tax=Treponema parvum TaxID=138851 RepID=UPI001AEC27BD|nr:glycoside hydrolase family 88 protein [Treponema parvum]QTQ17094.1 glycoside hydrolase family 88 protein [Treponema parvum]